MFGIGGGELIFIIFIALMLFGTDKIPEAARTFAKVISQLKNASNDIKSEIQKSADVNGITSSINEIKGNLTSQVDSIKNSVMSDEVVVSTNPFDKPKEIIVAKEDSEEATGPIKRQR
jgi:sec-independent protein translocase protein TatA